MRYRMNGCTGLGESRTARAETSRATVFGTLGALVLSLSALPAAAQDGDPPPAETPVEEAVTEDPSEVVTAATDAEEAEPAKEVLPTIFVRAARLIQRPGVVLENAQVLIEDGIVVAVGTDLEPPEGAQVVEGKVVCAGFLDPWSAFGVASDLLEDASTSATTLTVDGLLSVSPALDHMRNEALRAGVTAVRVQGGKHAVIGGLGAFLALEPEAELHDSVLLGDASLAMAVALSDGRSPQTNVRRLDDGSFVVETSGPAAVDIFERIDHADRVAANVTGGKKYLEELRDYRQKLAEWEKQIAEKEVELDKNFKKAKKDREKEIEEAKEKGREPKEERYKEDKKPRAPRHDPDKAVLGRIAEGELPLVVEAHRSAEIRALLDSTKELTRMRWILAGGTEALVHAEELAKRGIPVLVWPALRGTGGLDEHEGGDLALAGRLAAKGVTVLLGSGGRDGSTTRDLPLLAALAVAHGLSGDKAFEAMTVGAARAFDLADQVGTVEFGKRADLLVLDGEPLDTTTRVQYVLTGGRVAVAPEEN